MAKKLVKSNSNYVLRTKHQEIDGGIIYERDITTIGGRDRFAKGQVPIYKSGNFVITVNNEDTAYRKTSTQEWKGNNEGDVWTLDILKDYEKDEKSSYDKKIVIKKDYYDLRDFAYYGSCSELIRTSVNNIIDKFPGELFVPIINTWIFDADTEDEVKLYAEAAAKAYAESTGKNVPEPTKNTIRVTYNNTKEYPSVGTEFKLPSVVKCEDETTIDGGENATLFAIDNPFGINIHDNVVPNGENPLKYFADGGVDNYVAYRKVNGEWDFDNPLEIKYNGFTQCFVNATGLSVSSGCVVNADLVSITGTPEYTDTYCPGDFMGYVDLSIGDNDCNVRIYVFMGDNNEIKYFFDPVYDNGKYSCFLDIRIRPKNDIIEDYYEELNNFEKILLDRGTNYYATFEIIQESDYGYFIETKRYKFPTTYGGFNLGSSGSSFSEYIENLAKIGEYYDERFTDNLWRSMTHEAIKNFDWTYTRHFNPGDEIDYVEGGSKIQKIIRLYGREFDETRSYIDAISDNNTITYDNINNLPDYFFSDKLEDDGWDVKLINPLKMSAYIINNDKKKADVTDKIAPSDNSSNTYDGKHIDRVFTEITDTVKPYTKYNITSLRNVKCNENINVELYESGCCEDKVCTTFEAKNALENAIDLKIASVDTCKCDDRITDLTTDVGEFQRDGYHDDCCHDIKIYSSEKEYTTADVNSEFLKRFILNSKDILRHKGTIDSIEMLLSLFGLKSKNYVYTNDSYFRVEDNENLVLSDFGKRYYGKVDLTTAQAYDYDIKEYTLFTTRIEDKYEQIVDGYSAYTIDWLNSLKLTSYNTPEFKRGQYVSYQGLPVSYRYSEEPSDTKPTPTRYVYPSFQNYLPYDGGLYYQMDGGWLSKYPCMFDTKNNIINVDYSTDNLRNSMLFTETVKNINCVKTLDELLSNKSLAMHNGDICEVTDLSGVHAIIDGFVYELHKEEEGFYFFYATVVNNSLSVGSAFFTDYVYVSNPYADDNKIRINLNDETYNGKNIKIYVIKDGEDYDVDVHSNSSSISTFTLFKDGKYMEGENYSNYFRINNPDFNNELSVLGWQQLKKDEYEYYLMDSITDYDKGNNPHTGHMNYDKGHKYLTYFSRLFKTVYENSLFDYNLVPGDIDVYSMSHEYGFDNLINRDDECFKDYDQYLQEDVKCHYFGDYFTTAGTVTKYSLDNRDYMTGTIRKTLLGTGKLEKLKYGAGIEGNIDGVTNQIVNTKRVDIDFYLNSDVEYSNEWVEEVKYIDSVILPYLTQVVPSTIILTVNYKKKSDKVCTPST